MGAHGRAHPTFGMTPTFQKKKKKKFFKENKIKIGLIKIIKNKNLKSWCRDNDSGH